MLSVTMHTLRHALHTAMDTAHVPVNYTQCMTHVTVRADVSASYKTPY